MNVFLFYIALLLALINIVFDITCYLYTFLCCTCTCHVCESWEAIGTIPTDMPILWVCNWFIRLKQTVCMRMMNAIF